MKTSSAVLGLLVVLGQFLPACHATIEQVHLDKVLLEDPYAPAQLPTVHYAAETPSLATPKPAPGHLTRPAVAEPGKQAAMPPKVPLFAVVWMSALMSMMSCLGVLPYFFVRKLSKPWAGLANAVASGVMLAASFGLLAEGSAYSGTYLVAGMLLGVLFVKLSQQHLEQYEVDSFEQLVGADARKVILFLAVMAVHAVGEGGGVGVSFAGDRGWAQGTLITMAIGLHNIPEGLAVATVMAAKGAHPARALLWTALTALPQALVAPPAYLFVDTFRVLLPVALGFAAGCMVWIVLAELLPDALEAVEAQQVATYATGAAAWLQGLSVFMSHLETPSGTLASPFADYQEVLPLGLPHLLMHLLPSCLLSGLVAALCVNALCSRPQGVCAAAGMLAAISLASSVQLLLSSSHQVLCGLLLPLVGAAMATAVYMYMLRDKSSSLANMQKPHRNGYWHFCDKNNMASEQQKGDKTPRSRFAEVADSPTVALSTTTAGCCHSRAGQADCQEWQQSISRLQQQPIPSMQAYALTGLDNSNVNCYSASANSKTRNSWHSPQLHQQYQELQGVGERSLWCQKSPVKQAGHRPLQLHDAHEFNLSKCGVGLMEGRCSSSWLGCLDGSKTTSRGSGSSLTAACWLAVCGAAGCGVPLGLQLASAVAAEPNSMSHALIPLTLLGAVFGAILLGLLGQPLVHMIDPFPFKIGAAASFSSTAAAVAMVILLIRPAWVQVGSFSVVTDVLQGLLVGFNLAVLLFLLKAVHKHWGSRKCLVGLSAGFCVGLLTCLCMAMTCWGTSYCLQLVGFHATVMA